MATTKQCDKCLAVFTMPADNARWYHHIHQCDGPPDGQRIIICDVCDGKYITRTAAMSEHWAVCTYPGRQRAKEAEEIEEAEAKRDYHLDELQRVLGNREAAVAVLATIEAYTQ